jgi:hypothetical protein
MDVEGSGSDVMEVPLLNLSGETEKYHDSQGSRCLGQDSNLVPPEWEPQALPLRQAGR